MKGDFKNNFPFQMRHDESDKILKKYPDRYPCIIERDPNCDLPHLLKSKFLVPNTITFGQLIYIIRKRIKISPDQGLFIFVNNVLPPSSSILDTIYREYKDEDNFLYFVYRSESVFG